MSPSETPARPTGSRRFFGAARGTVALFAGVILALAALAAHARSPGSGLGALLRELAVGGAVPPRHEPLALVSTLGLAAGLGAAVAWVPRPTRDDWQAARAAAFLATSGALMMLIVGNELARAFGLMGAASVVRYRYGLRTARDASALILSLGIGMACGTGALTLALFGTGTVLALGAVFALPEVTLLRAPLGRTALVEVRGREPEVHDRAEATLRALGIDPTLVEVESKEVRDSNGQGVYKFVYEVRVEAATSPVDLVRALSGESVIEVHLRDRPPEWG